MRPSQQPPSYGYVRPPLPRPQLPSQHGPCLPHPSYMAGSGTAAPGIPALGVPMGPGQYEYLQGGVVMQGGEVMNQGWMNPRPDNRGWVSGVFAQGRPPQPQFNGGMAMTREGIPNPVYGHGLHQTNSHAFQQQPHQAPQMMPGVGLLRAPHPSAPPGYQYFGGQPVWGQGLPGPGWYGGMPPPHEANQFHPLPPDFGYMDPGAGGGSRRSAPEGNRGIENSVPHVLSSQKRTEQLHCAACDRSFFSSQQRAAHMNTHVKCDAQGCTFEASTRIVKEHKVTHGKKPSLEPVAPRKPISKEAEVEAQRWRDERRKNYPTVANVKRREEELAARRARGEMMDEEACKRRERLKEVLAKQAQLGCAVAEVPDYMLRDTYGAGRRPAGQTRVNGKRRIQQDTALNTTLNCVNGERPAKVARLENDSQVDDTAEEGGTSIAGGNVVPISEVVDGKEPDNLADTRQSRQGTRTCHYFLRGRCKKGWRCEFRHERNSRHKGMGRENRGQQMVEVPAQREPSLLTKLLEPEVQRDHSHILQCLRFFVDNNFLLDYPKKPLEFSSWLSEEERMIEAENCDTPEKGCVADTAEKCGTPEKGCVADVAELCDTPDRGCVADAAEKGDSTEKGCVAEDLKVGDIAEDSGVAIVAQDGGVAAGPQKIQIAAIAQDAGVAAVVEEGSVSAVAENDSGAGDRGPGNEIQQGGNTPQGAYAFSRLSEEERITEAENCNTAEKGFVAGIPENFRIADIAEHSGGAVALQDGAGVAVAEDWGGATGTDCWSSSCIAECWSSSCRRCMQDGARM